MGQDNFHNLGYVDSLMESLKFLVYLPCLKKLNLSRNHLKDVFVKNLLPVLVQLRLEHLDLSCNNINDDGFLYLCQYLKDTKANQSLQSLLMNYNKFRIPTAAKEIAEAL